MESQHCVNIHGEMKIAKQKISPLCDIFNLSSSYLNVALATVHHLYTLSSGISTLGIV